LLTPFFWIKTMKRLKKEHIGTLVYIPMLGKQIEVTEANAKVIMGYGLHNLFEENKPTAQPKKTKVSRVKTVKDDDSNK